MVPGLLPLSVVGSGWAVVPCGSGRAVAGVWCCGIRVVRSAPRPWGACLGRLGCLLSGVFWLYGAVRAGGGSGGGGGWGGWCWSGCGSERQYVFERMSYIGGLRFSFRFGYRPGPPDKLSGDVGRRGWSELLVFLAVAPRPGSAAGFPHDPAAGARMSPRPEFLVVRPCGQLAVHRRPAVPAGRETGPAAAEESVPAVALGALFCSSPLQFNG